MALKVAKAKGNLGIVDYMLKAPDDELVAFFGSSSVRFEVLDDILRFGKYDLWL